MALAMAVKLTPEEHAEIEVLVKSPVYRTLQKLGEQYKGMVMEELLSTESPEKIFNLQGRIIGVNAMQNIPGMVASIREREEKVRSEREAIESKKHRATREKQI